MTVIINGTTGISGVDGSAGTPAVQGSDTNTGVFYPAADTVGVSTGGTRSLTQQMYQQTAHSATHGSIQNDCY